MNIRNWVYLLMLLTFASLTMLQAQEPDAPQAENQATEQPAEPEENLTESQQNTRAVSLAELQRADQKLNEEREAIAKRERRLQMLLEDIQNQEETLAAKESELEDMFQRFEQDEQNFRVPPKLVEHYESRGPKTAAEDFVKLWTNEPRVAVALIREMKKKRSAALIDEVAKLGDNGKTIAARIHEAIGTGRIPNENI
jgi:flagellar motility protein MotE (MotC chaperone)